MTDSYDYDKDVGSLLVGVCVIPPALAGILFSGWLSDRLAARRRTVRLRTRLRLALILFCVSLGLPLAVVAFSVHLLGLFLAMLVAAMFLLFCVLSAFRFVSPACFCC